jgi:hypothetical protein
MSNPNPDKLFDTWDDLIAYYGGDTLDPVSRLYFQALRQELPDSPPRDGGFAHMQHLEEIGWWRLEPEQQQLLALAYARWMLVHDQAPQEKWFLSSQLTDGGRLVPTIKATIKVRYASKRGFTHQEKRDLARIFLYENVRAAFYIFKQESKRKGLRTVTKGVRLPRQELYEAYRNWCVREIGDKSTLKLPAFNKVVHDHFKKHPVTEARVRVPLYSSDRPEKNGDGHDRTNKVRVWEGLRLRTAPAWEDSSMWEDYAGHLWSGETIHDANWRRSRKRRWCSEPLHN